MSQDHGNPFADDSNPFAGNPNPYQAPVEAAGVRQPIQQTRYPVFCKIIFIMSIVFCVLRIFMVVLAIPGYSILQRQDDPMVVTVVFEIGAGIGMVVFGLLANGLMLAGKRMGILFAWPYVLSVMTSMGVGVWQATFLMDKFPAGSPEQIGATVGAGIGMIIRLGLLALYVAAIFAFRKWAREQQRI